MTGCHNKSNAWTHSPLKSMLGKIRDRYQSYCATYKTHNMTTCHGGAGHTGKDRDFISHIEDTRGIDIGPNNDIESTNSSDTTTAFRGSEVDGHLGDLLPNGQANLSVCLKEKSTACGNE